MQYPGSGLVRAVVVGMSVLAMVGTLAPRLPTPSAEARSAQSDESPPLTVGANAPAPASESAWLTRVNYFRSLAGVPPIQENPTDSANTSAHAVYMLQNNQITHEEDPNNPWYTEAGAVAGGESNLFLSTEVDTSDSVIIDFWMTSAFHQLGILSSALREAGYGVAHGAKDGYQTAAALDVLPEADSTDSLTPPAQFPGDGVITPLTTYWGNEIPDPLTSCQDYTAPTGAPITLAFGSGSAVEPVRVSDWSLRRDGDLVASCAFDQYTYSNPNAMDQSNGQGILAMRQAIILIPRDPLVPGATYAVSLTVNGTVYNWEFAVSKRE